MEIIVATNNQNKAREIYDVLHKHFQDLNILTPKEVRIFSEPVEDGETFEQNALIKAKSVWSKGKIAIADDSGLCVNALNGEPSINSARYSGQHGNDKENNKKLLKNLASCDDRSAFFVCAIACILPHGVSFTVRGEVHGVILKEEIGNNGFGYDPLFYYPQFDKTFAQLSLDEKNSISHRANALSLLANKLKELNI